MYFLNIFNNLLINILLFVLIYLIKSEEEFNFNIGNLNLFCPEPKENWHSVGTGCFKKIFKKFNWTVANEFCQNFENNSSNSLFLDNFLLYKELSKVLNKEFSGSFEFWTSWYIKLNNSKELPERIFKFNSTYSISIYNPNWALLQPQFEEFLNDKENILCISWNSMLSDKENFGWRLRNCSELLPTICQTFACFLDSNKHPQHRCSDNSGCISNLNFCNGIKDCKNGEDEINNNCLCSNDKIIKKEFSSPYGNIYYPLIKSSKQNLINIKCPNQQLIRYEWLIKNKFGAKIKLNFLSLHLNYFDKLKLKLENNKEININNLNTSNYLIGENKLIIIFEKYINDNFNDDSYFYLQYFIDEASVCERTFESWNGTLSPPLAIPDNNGYYKTQIKCHWIINNKNNGIVFIKLLLNQLILNDWLLIKLIQNNQQIIYKNLTSNYINYSFGFLSTFSEIHFIFNSNRNLIGGKGFKINFERNCLNQQINFGNYGYLEIPEENNLIQSSFNCSWQINIPCKKENNLCPFNIFVDSLVATEDDEILFKTNDGNTIAINSTNLKLPFLFRSNYSSIQIQIHSSSPKFNLKINYSIDCLLPKNQKIPKNQQKLFPYRNLFKYICNKNRGTLICSENGKWKYFDGNEENKIFNGCLLKEEEGEFNKNNNISCIVPVVHNGFIVELNRSKGFLRFGCQFGYKPLENKNNNLIISYCLPNGNWECKGKYLYLYIPKCKEIICSEPPLNASFSKQKYSSEFFLSPQLDRKTNKNLFGSIAFYVCPEGTIPRGNRNFAICAENGEWTEDINLACLLNGCPPFHLNFGNFTKVWTPLFSFAQIKCQEGFNLTKRIPQCILNKNTKIPVWDYVDLNICEQIIKGLALCSNGKYQSNNSLTISYKCECPDTHLLYTKESAKNILIPSTKSLLSELSCIRKRCPIISTTKYQLNNYFLKISNPLFLIGTNITIYCKNENSSFLIEKQNNLIKCLNNGEWSEENIFEKIKNICSSKENKNINNSYCLFNTTSSSILLPDKNKVLVGDKFAFVCSQPNYLINKNLTKICVKGGYINLNTKIKRNKNENIIKCPFGLHLNNKGECTKNENIWCHSCSSKSDINCLTNPTLSKTNKCLLNQLCSVQTFSNGTGQPPFEVFRGCSDKQIDCGIFEENISVRQSCQTNHLGIEKCIGCCSVDFCNYLLPNELFIRNNLNDEGKLDNEELPECIDKQLIEIKCEPFLNVRKMGNGLTEPILIVWPQITDNDPYFNIRPLNIPLVHPNIPISLPDNLTEIQWEVVDRHGIVIKCFTKLKFLEEEKKNNNLESPPITISIELLPIWSTTTLNNKNINCIKNLIKSIRPSLLKLISQKCPNINWGSQSQFYNLTKITQNFTTGIENTPNNLNKCIRLLEEFFVNSSMPLVPINLFNGECPNGPFSVQKHSFIYHSNCSDGWVFNKELLKCVEYQKILNKSSRNFEVFDKNCKAFCKCNLGFTGIDCSIPLNLCNASFCLNGGKCLFDYLNGSKCLCLDGFNGTRCEINQKQEEDNNVENNLNNDEEINRNNCQLNKCLNGGICSINNNENILSTKCLCPPNFEGNNCQIKKETKIEKCKKENWCGNNGYCKIFKEAEKNIFEEEIIFCECNEGFFGEFCESRQNNNLKNNSCECLNGGECTENNLCKCLIGFYGNKCQFKLNPCNLFNGLCLKEENYECNAYFNMSTGTIELLCKCGENNEGNYSCIPQLNNLCINQNNFCKNGGECISFNSSIKCKCLNNYFGNNCEYLMNYCSLPEICLNGGNCLNGDNKYFCECLNNGSGINCENPKENLFIDGDNSMDILENPCKQNPDFCNNAGECHLLPNTTHRYCKCLPLFTGIYCETKKLPNFNLYFAGIKAKINSPINQKINSQLFPCRETLEKFTFCLWVKFGEIDKNFINNYFENERKRQTFFTFAMFNGKNYTSLLELDEFNLNIFTSKNSQLKINYGNKENFENIWNHICIVSNGNNLNNYLSLYLNGNLIKNLIFSWKWPELINNECIVFIGENGNEENNNFIGQISKAELYSELFNSKQINYLLNNCLNNNYFSIEPSIAWTDFSSVIVYNSAIIVIHPGICLNNYCKFGEIRSTKISIKCPESQQIILDNPNQRLINVNWDDSFNKMFPFSIQNPIVRFESNFRPGQIFTWGYHRIIYYVEDSFGYWNSCEFNIIISPNKCQLPSNNSKNNSTILILNKMDLKENSEAEFNAKLFCKNNEYIFKKQRPFYICDRLGKWNHWENIGIPFEFPLCSSTENVLQEIEGNLNFNGFCSNYNEYQDEITRSILNISEKFGGFCEKQNCDGQLFIRSACSFEIEEKSIIWMEGNFNKIQKRLIKREENKKIIKIKFYLNLRNLKYSVGPIILNYLKSLFGNNFNQEQTRLSCSDNFPQFDIENKSNINISDPNSLPIIQCSTCAPGETWKDTEQKFTTISTKNFDFILNKNISSGKCEKCPPNTFKTTEGVQNCIPCPDGRITGGVSGCIYLSDCFKNCSPGYIYNWENDKCIPCPRGQFMPYSGRLKCLACPIDRTTVGEGSINKEECSIKCKDGEEMGQNEQCQPCSKGTFREGLMSVCQRCQIGFTTKKEGSLNSKECNQINCPPGYFGNNKLINEEINLNFEFLQICLPCPIGYYQNEYGSNKCKKCPEGYMTKQLGAKNIFECDQVWNGSCKPDQPEPCPNGSECVQIRGEIFECRKIFVEFLNNEQNIREQRIKRFWFPLILGIICVIIIGILFLFFILNRKKCLLFFHQYFYCCGKTTLDNLNNNNFTRNDLPIFTTTQPLQNIINQSFNQQNQPNKNIKRRAISDSDLLRRNQNLINDPINQIKNNLMEELENKENNNIEIKIPPKLTVQTSFKEIENNKFRQRIYSCSSSSSSSSSHNYGIIEENENKYQNEKTENSNARLCVFTMDEEIENQKYQIKREEDSSEKSKEFPSSELITQINLTNVELRRIQLEKQLKITPFQSGLRSSLTARNINRLPPPNNNLKKKHPPTNNPSYDDDDDAFFS